MGASTLSSRAIIGQFYFELEVARAQMWYSRIAKEFKSDQGEETYPFLTSSPVMQEWIGGRRFEGLDERSIKIPNRHFEATIEFLLKDIRRDKTGQIRIRVADLARRSAAHPHQLLGPLVQAGESSLCYDGQYFFDTDHSDTNSGTQSNSLALDTLTLGVDVAQVGTATAPGPRTLVRAATRAIEAMITFKDERGEPTNTNARRFLVVCPVSYFPTINAAAVEKWSNLELNELIGWRAGGYTIDFVTDPRLTWTNKFAVFREDTELKPFVYQVETSLQIKAKAEGSEFEFDNAAHQYGVDQWCNMAYGYWQNACLVTLS